MTLADLVARLEQRAADAEAIHAQAPVATLYRALLEELAAVDGRGNGHPDAPPPGELLTVEVAAARLGVSVGWLYRRSSTLPFARKLGPKTLRFDAGALDKWALARRGGTR